MPEGIFSQGSPILLGAEVLSGSATIDTRIYSLHDGGVLCFQGVIQNMEVNHSPALTVHTGDIVVLKLDRQGTGSNRMVPDQILIGCDDDS